MKKYVTGISAIVLGACLALSMSAFKNSAPSGRHLTDYYYEFTGIHGQESTMSLWTQIATESDYEEVDCPAGSGNSCKITNNTNSGTHPTSVPLNTSGFPKLGTVNSDVVLKHS